MNVKLVDGKPFLVTNYHSLCEHHHLDKPDNEIIKEATYKEIQMFIDNDFLKQRVRANALEGVRLKGFDENSLIFNIKSSQHKDNNITYLNQFKINDWDAFIDETEFSPIDRARLMMLQGDLMLHCTCPSFLFWGYQYLLTQIDAAIVPEDRPPNVRNPKQRGIVCKHLNRALRSFPFFTSDFARHIRQNHNVKKGKDAVDDKNSQKTLEAFKSNTNDDILYEDILKWNTVKKK
jgi:hypothetical protein